MNRTKELDAALAWADDKPLSNEQRRILHEMPYQSYCDASEKILAAEVRRLEADKRRLDSGCIKIDHKHWAVDVKGINLRDAIDAAMEASK